MGCDVQPDIDYCDNCPYFQTKDCPFHREEEDDWVPVSKKMPPVETPVFCLIRSFNTNTIRQEKMIHVDEDDVVWRTADDRSELNEMNWNVEKWRKA